MRNIYKELVEKPRRRIIGILSGTSADGASIALTEIRGSGKDIDLELIAFKTYPYPSSFREKVFQLFSKKDSTVELICKMNFALGEFFARKILQFIEDLDPGKIDLIGSHGQTIWHAPRSKEIEGYSARSTLQIGEPTIIAERTGIPVVSDFRKADIAAGGEGAPLTPYLDYILFSSPYRSRVIQNIGGIANLTYLPKATEAEGVIAFDTGPGNMIIDSLIEQYTGGYATYDIDGEIASKGDIDRSLLKELLNHPYFALQPPKSTGREAFGEEYINTIIKLAERKGVTFEDLVATATALTVESIAGAYESLPGKVEEVYLSGGGANNSLMVEALKRRIKPTPVYQHGVLGIHAEAKEAVLFATLANEHIMGVPANLPSVTGARRRVILGVLHNLG